jgi:hypothetical protein
MPKTKAQLLADAEPGYVSARMVARNTVRLIYLNPTRMIIRYHSTDVVTIYTNGLRKFSSGGYITHTTKRRIERYGGVRIETRWIRRGYSIWILPDGRQFEDGILWRNDPEMDIDDPRHDPDFYDPFEPEEIAIDNLIAQRGGFVYGAPEAPQVWHNAIRRRDAFDRHMMPRELEFDEYEDEDIEE